MGVGEAFQGPSGVSRPTLRQASERDPSRPPALPVAYQAPSQDQTAGPEVATRQTLSRFGHFPLSRKRKVPRDRYRPIPAALLLLLPDLGESPPGEEVAASGGREPQGGQGGVASNIGDPIGSSKGEEDRRLLPSTRKSLKAGSPGPGEREGKLFLAPTSFPARLASRLRRCSSTCRRRAPRRLPAGAKKRPGSRGGGAPRSRGGSLGERKENRSWWWPLRPPHLRPGAPTPPHPQRPWRGGARRSPFGGQTEPDLWGEFPLLSSPPNQI